MQIGSRTFGKPTPRDLIFKPFKNFAQIESSGGIILIVATVAALIWANSSMAESYHHLWETEVGFSFGAFELHKHLIHWINDGLMAIFFFVVGLEIKREILVGELSSWRKAALPIAAAIGGMVVPAGIYVIFNAGKPSANGWGVPMATDIAFALGILALLGKRVPLSLKVFLTALAIIDDIGAVLVIAIFYTADISWVMLGASLVVTIFLLLLNRLEFKHPLFFILPGVLLWFFLLKSGLHATIAGVVCAMTVPAKGQINSHQYLKESRALLDVFTKYGVQKRRTFINEQQLCVVHSLHSISAQLETPLQRMEHMLHAWTTYAIIPVFALANAGVVLRFDSSLLVHPLTLGIIFGLVVGKQVGILFFSWLAVKLRIASKPEGMAWLHIYGAGWLAGVGFTMSLFITNLAFTDAAQIQKAKIGVLLASILAGAIGFVILKRKLGNQVIEEEEETLTVPPEPEYQV